MNVHSNRKSVSHGFLAGIFSTLDRFGVVVDLISTSEVHVSMAIEDGLAKKLMDRLVKELKKSGTVRIWSMFPIDFLLLLTSPFYLFYLVLWLRFSFWFVIFADKDITGGRYRCTGTWQSCR
jgi:hypothetical protein